MQGGFLNGKENIRPRVLTEPFMAFPPLSNHGYMLTSTGHDPKFVHRTEQANATFIPRSCIKAILTNPMPDTIVEEEEQSTEPDEPENSESIAGSQVKGTKDENQWTDPTGATSDIGQVNKTVALVQDKPTDEVLMFCRKCEKKHIPEGSFLYLASRDTCGSYLPDWFPSEDYGPGEAWTAFNELNNQILRLESLERGDRTIPKPWDKVYHDDHPVWRSLGYGSAGGGGWWRCRRGPEAPKAEQKCYDCHENKAYEMPLSKKQTMEYFMKQLEHSRQYVRRNMDRVGQQGMFARTRKLYILVV